MNSSKIISQSFPNGVEPALLEQYPFFELAYIARALQTPTSDHKHQAGLVLQNSLWFQYLQANYNTFKSTTTVAAVNTQPDIAAAEIQGENNIADHTPPEENTINAVFDAHKEVFTDNQSVDDENCSLETTKNEEIVIQKLQNEASASEIIDNQEVVDVQVDELSFVDSEKDTQSIENESDNVISSNLSKAIEANDLKSLLADIKLNKETSNTPSDEPIPIEVQPLHATDYFGSQGVKTGSSNVDRLTVQLRSFTQWLKTMKKVEALSTTVETQEELITHHNVVNMAEMSVKKQDVITENMVDVLVKQGRTNEAILLLEKLSLQEPTKSVYFATQIEKLKQ